MAAQEYVVVAYRARTEAIANRLVETLAEAAIEAVVVPEELQGTEPGDTGYAVRVRIADQASAAKATRQFLDDYHNRKLDWDQESTESLAHWPVCPECESPRIAKCSVCGRMGVDFPPNDPDFDWGMAQADSSDEEGTPVCSCSGGTCAGGETQSDTPHSMDEPPCDDEPHDSEIILRCPSCDEPFVPVFAQECPWCEHRFEDGFELELGDGGIEIDPRRALMALAVLLMVFGGPFTISSSRATAIAGLVMCFAGLALLGVSLLLRR